MVPMLYLVSVYMKYLHCIYVI